MCIKWMNTCIKTRVLTFCCCAGSCEEGFMEEVKRDKCVYTFVRMCISLFP